MSTENVPLWKCLISSLEKDCQGTVNSIKFLKGYEDSYSPTVPFGKQDFDTGFTADKMFCCYVHKRLCMDFALASKDPWQKLIQRLRAVMESEDFLEESDIRLLKSANTKMGGGLNPSPVSLIPDSSLGATFGSVPDQNVIASKATCWKVVKRRCYEAQSGKLGKKPHYVLAHLLNHNLNGPGDNVLNVVPFWGGANTDMANKVEKFVKELVLSGVVVTYEISCGPPMKSDATYAAWAKNATGTADQLEIIKWEQELPQFLSFSATAIDGKGIKVNVVPSGIQIKNFVPMTVPTIY
jgi:hypothetical protein